MNNKSYAVGGVRPSSFFYGWYIVGVGILVNIAQAVEKDLAKLKTLLEK